MPHATQAAPHRSTGRTAGHRRRRRRPAGAQSIWANSYSNWGVWADHPNTGGVKSYPHVNYRLGRDVFEITSSTGGRNFNCNSYSLWT
ncbi:glycoside hydrolase family 12 protein [Glycomyces dulcitolivorans]|uniref:hypothetical protein n=1 Tax=Glycomyces dulcitolivorans TaxID=2200759 RepID=UPI000DD3A197|nr:hypothetical protein [Glycomyces dulcitolivorans]